MMTESKHTPGPWKVIDGDSHNGYPEEQSEYEYRVIPESTEPRPDNLIASFWDTDWGYEALANAALIAAAPDLLAACEHIDKWFRSMLEYIPDYEWEQIEPVVAAIAKARGK